jgi:hypothetical protein
MDGGGGGRGRWAAAAAAVAATAASAAAAAAVTGMNELAWHSIESNIRFHKQCRIVRASSWLGGSP